MKPSTSPEFISHQVRRSRLFFLNLEPGAVVQSTVVCGGFEAVSRDYEINRSDFPWLSLELVVSGTGRLALGAEELPLRAGSFFLYGPGLPHRIWSTPDAPLEKYFVDFTGRDALGLLEALGLQPGASGENTRPDLLRALFDSLIDAGIRRSNHAVLHCSAILTQLLINCAEFRALSGTLNSRAFETFERCRNRITSQASSLRSLGEMASLCHVDAAYLCRLFSRFGGETPRDFLLRVKIERAAELLLSTTSTVKQVAESQGFADPFHFSKVFKRLKGVPPARFALAKRPG